MAFAEKFVFNTKQVPAFDNEVTASCQAHRVAPRCPVKRFGDRRTPVDNDRFTIFVGNGKTTYVKRLKLVRRFRVAIDPTKDE
jgi:hypothetical protein